MNEIEYALVGGFVKNIVELDCNKNWQAPKDFDIIANLPKGEIKHMLKFYKIPFRQNDFGSFKVKEDPDSTFAGHEIDIWSFDDHELFAKGLLKPEWKNIPESGILTNMGACWMPLSNKLYLGKLKQTLKSRVIKMYNPSMFWNEDISNKYILAGKLIHDWWENGFTLDQECTAFLTDYLSKPGKVEKVADYIENKYGYIACWEDKIKRILDQPKDSFGYLIVFQKPRSIS